MFKDILNSKEFIDGLQAGDNDAYTKLLDYGWHMLRPMYNTMRLSHLAKDLFYGTTCKLCGNNFASYQPAKGSFVAWFRTVARRDALNEIKKENYNRKSLESLVQETSLAPNPTKERSGKSRHEILARRAYESLAKDDQVVLEQRVIEKLPFEVIAENLGIQESAARMRVSRALTRFKDAFERLADCEIPKNINRSRRRDSGRTLLPPHKRQQEINSV